MSLVAIPPMRRSFGTRAYLPPEQKTTPIFWVSDSHMDILATVVGKRGDRDYREASGALGIRIASDKVELELAIDQVQRFEIEVEVEVTRGCRRKEGTGTSIVRSRGLPLVPPGRVTNTLRCAVQPCAVLYCAGTAPVATGGARC